MQVLYNYISDTRYKPTSDNKVTYSPNWTGYENEAYVNSMASTYSFLLPSDDAFKGYEDTPHGGYVDPFSVYENKPVSFRFRVDSKDKVFPVLAEAFEVDTTSGSGWKVNYGKPARGASQPTGSGASGLGRVNNRLSDILDNLIIVHGQKGARGFHSGQTIYLNKAGGPVQVEFQGEKVVGIAGSAQMERGTMIPVTQTVDLTETGNGVSYLLDSIPSSTLTSPYDLIHDLVKHPDYKEFANLLVPGSGLADKNANGSTNHPYLGNGITCLGNYHYTIYVPDSTGIQTLIKNHQLPTLEEYEQWGALQDSIKEYNTVRTEGGQKVKYISDEDADSLMHLSDSCRQIILTTIANFLRYHIQDGSVYLGGEQGTTRYETSSYDDETSLFRRLRVENTGTAIKIFDDKPGAPANVVDGKHSNQVSRQYSFTTMEGDEARRWIYGSAYVVVHLIDRPLWYDGMLLPDGFPKPEVPTPTPIIVTDSEVKRK
jgi:hypothetical protein